MRYDLILFDLDGTILDTLEDLKESANFALRAEGFPERTLQEIRAFVGNGIRKLMERIVPADASEADIQRVHTQFTAHYSIHCADHTKPYDGILQMMTALRGVGCKLAVVSNKADYAVQALCKQYFGSLLDAAAGEQMPLYEKKPSPDLVNLILERLNVPRERAVYIGDSDVDIQTARNAQMDCIAVDWGFRDRAFLKEHGAQIIVSNTQELLACLNDAVC